MGGTRPIRSRDIIPQVLNARILNKEACRLPAVMSRGRRRVFAAEEYIAKDTFRHCIPGAPGELSHQLKLLLSTGNRRDTGFGDQGDKVVTCNTCQMISKYPGESRMVIANSPGTPKVIRNFGSPDLRKPGSSRKVNLPYSEEKLGSKIRSPALTPRSCASATSSPALIAKSAKKGKFHFSRLKMLLSQEEKEQNKKQSLQNFLTSLS
ncbi:unnamed protein product [Ranitomeya imitator]|uniref:Uncharacterized protein n=1 Tax=Ranitomeya imitator TaxID=111125 RepID=A0ABN9M1J4_9NEOB|nr:unnamed protein product [Ranitomeya imitator]